MAPLFKGRGVVLVELTMTGAYGSLVSRNVYWLAAKDSDYRRLIELAPAQLTMMVATHREGGENVVDVRIVNNGKAPALASKLTLLGGSERILPAFSDNYLSLLPGESTDVTIYYPSAAKSAGKVSIGVRGWNVPEKKVAVAPARLGLL